ncbi:Uncharacterised protein [Burkholderia pseudomallei]|nr:Uncharacterised protein [Burkholderia pseudomallei]
MTSQKEQQDVTDQEAGRHILADVKMIIDEKFKAGEGVVAIGPDTPDEVILSTIKNAVSFGKPFTVVSPVKTFLHDELS